VPSLASLTTLGITLRWTPDLFLWTLFLHLRLTESAQTVELVAFAGLSVTNGRWAGEKPQ
jgi:hypothetical protein